MEHDREEELGEMYSPNEFGEYTLCSDMPNFTVQGLQDALKETEATVTEPSPLSRRIHYSIGSDYGRLTWKTATACLFMEWRFGATCAEE